MTSLTRSGKLNAVSASLESSANRIELASKQLNVSSATVRNWLRSKLLRSLSPQEIKLLKKKIKSGEINKLRSGANKKSAAEKFHFHPELLSAKLTKVQIRKVNEWLIADRKNPQQALGAIFSELCRLSNEKLLKTPVYEEILKRFGTFKEDVQLLRSISSLRQLHLSFDDSLLVYADQFLSDVATKSVRGAYFTDEKTVLSEVDAVVTGRGRFCDPCCGAGNYLKAAYLKLKKIDSESAEPSIFGYDINERAVAVSQARLFVLSDGRMKVLQQIKNLDALTSKHESTFDFICTNPPWGADLHENTELNLCRAFHHIKTRESFSLFIIKINEMLKNNGVTGLILPNALIYVRAHEEIRRWIFENYKILSLEYSKAKFSGVMSKPISLVMQKGETDLTCRDFRLHFQTDRLNQKIIEKIERRKNCETLKENAAWALGIVTGDNARFVFAERVSETEPLIRGTDIYKFRIKKSTNFIGGASEKFQQMAPIDLYRAEQKLVYRFICNEPVFAVDDERRLTLNSANIVIPQFKKVSIYAVCAVMNSPVVAFFLKQKFQSVKLLRSHIESVPLPRYECAPLIWQRIDKLSRGLHRKFSHEQLAKLYKLVYELYGLNASEAECVEKEIGISRFHANDEESA